MYVARGVYEVCRFTRQPDADAFIDWTWDIVEAIRKGRISEKVLRDACITVRRTMTDSIRDYYEESSGKKYLYKNITDLVYKYLFDMNTKQIKEHLGLEKNDSLRDYFTTEELELVIQTERRVQALVELGMRYDAIKNVLNNKKPITRALPRKRVREVQEEAN